MSRRIICLGAIVAFGFALRVIGIEQQPLWGDEGLTLLIAQWPFTALFLVPNDPTPGLYYALHKLLIGPNAGLLAARSISLIAGTAAIIATFACARAGRIPAIAAAALTALSFALIDYSQEARAYSLLVLLVILSGWAFIWWHRSRGWASALAFAASIILSFYTHFISIFWIVPMIAAALLMAWRDPDARRKLEWTLCLVIVLATPEAIRLNNYPPRAFSWLEQAGPVDALNTASYVLLPFGLFENEQWGLGRNLIAIASLVCFGLVGWRTYAHRRKLKEWAGKNPAAATFLLISLSLPATIWLFGFAAKPIFLPRTILIGVPGFVMALSLLLKFEHRLAMPTAVAVYALNLAFTGTVRPKEDWRSVADTLSANVRTGDVVVLCPAWKASAFRHAMRKPVDAPLLLRWDDGVMQIEPRLGADPNWAESYFDTLSHRRGFAEGQESLAGAKRIWRVTSDCRHQ
jgi:hypothetical protein